MYMIEGTPGKPYEGFTADLRLVEINMALRRRLIQEALDTNEYVLSLTAFPMLGVGEFCIPWQPVPGPIANSQFVPDSVTNDHPRFPYCFSSQRFLESFGCCSCLTRNIRERRGSNVCITVPLFVDEDTAKFFPPCSEEKHSDPVSDTVDPDAGSRKDCLEVFALFFVLVFDDLTAYIHGLYGFWNGMLLPPGYFSS
jgi:hypothetical protein